MVLALSLPGATLGAQATPVRPAVPAAAPSPAAPVAGIAPVGPVARWAEIARTPALAAFIDTARIARPAAGLTRVWFRFEYAVPQTAGSDTTIRYRATEAQQDIECAQRRTRDVAMRLETTDGISAGAPFPPGGAWKSFDGHALGTGVFLVTCRALGEAVPGK